MNPISVIGAFIMTLALLSFGIASITLQRFKMVGRSVLWLFFIGLLLDITAIVCMLIGAGKISFTLHELLGYTAFIVMLFAFIMVCRVFRKNGRNAIINKSQENLIKLAYGWWVIAYLTGSILVIY